MIILDGNCPSRSRDRGSESKASFPELQGNNAITDDVASGDDGDMTLKDSGDCAEGLTMAGNLGQNQGEGCYGELKSNMPIDSDYSIGSMVDSLGQELEQSEDHAEDSVEGSVEPSSLSSVGERASCTKSEDEQNIPGVAGDETVSKFRSSNAGAIPRATPGGSPARDKSSQEEVLATVQKGLQALDVGGDQQIQSLRSDVSSAERTNRQESKVEQIREKKTEKSQNKEGKLENGENPCQVSGFGATLSEGEAALFPVHSSSEERQNSVVRSSMHHSTSDSNMSYSSSSFSSSSHPGSSILRSVSTPCHLRTYYDIMLVYNKNDEDNHASNFRSFADRMNWKLTSTAELPIGKLNLKNFRTVMERCSYVVLLISPHFLEDHTCERFYNIAIQYGDEHDEEFFECVLPVVFDDATLPPELDSITHIQWGQRYFERVMENSVDRQKRIQREEADGRSGSPVSMSPPVRAISEDHSRSQASSGFVSMAPSVSSVHEVEVDQRQRKAPCGTPQKKTEEVACLLPTEEDSPSFPPIPVSESTPPAAHGSIFVTASGSQTQTISQATDVATQQQPLGADKPSAVGKVLAATQQPQQLQQPLQHHQHYQPQQQGYHSLKSDIEPLQETHTEFQQESLPSLPQTLIQQQQVLLERLILLQQQVKDPQQQQQAINEQLLVQQNLQQIQEQLLQRHHNQQQRSKVSPQGVLHRADSQQASVSANPLMVPQGATALAGSPQHVAQPVAGYPMGATSSGRAQQLATVAACFAQPSTSTGIAQQAAIPPTANQHFGTTVTQLDVSGAFVSQQPLPLTATPAVPFSGASRTPMPQQHAMNVVPPGHLGAPVVATQQPNQPVMPLYSSTGFGAGYNYPMQPIQDYSSMSAEDIFRRQMNDFSPGQAAAEMFSSDRFSQVCELLDGSDPRGMDWSVLAEIVGLASSQVNILRKTPTGATKKVLEIFFLMNGQKERLEVLKELSDILKNMNRHDAAEIVDKEVLIARFRRK